MTLQQIYYALVIAEAGSMNKAAEKLFISQPTMTAAIKELEQETGITLFLRSNKGVSITNEGSEFLKYARQLYQQYDLLKQRFTEKTNVKRKFTVSAQHYSFTVKAFVEMVKQYDTLKYEFAMKETRTLDVINDVGSFRSEIGILFMSNFNRKYISRLLADNGLEFHPIVECRASVYLWKNHPLAHEKSISFKQLAQYPYLFFDQGDGESFFLAEEILSENDYLRTIRTSDRATMLNLMVGLNGYILCSGIICEELNGSDYIAIPYEADEENPNSTMQIGYIKLKDNPTSDIADTYIKELKQYFIDS